MIGDFLNLMMFHAVADGPLQAGLNDKRNNPAALVSHGIVHGFFVALVLGPALGLAEAIAHCGIDYAKGRGWLGHRHVNLIDQALHVACKVLWIAIAMRTA